MERSAIFYALFGAGIVFIPAIVDRALQGRVPDWLRILIDFIAAGLAGVGLVMLGMWLEL
jgi:hypothetical protein